MIRRALVAILPRHRIDTAISVLPSRAVPYPFLIQSYHCLAILHGYSGQLPL